MNKNLELVEYLKDINILKSPEIIEAFEKVDRGDFAGEQNRAGAYLNVPLSIGYGQTISQPLVVAFMLEQLKPGRGDKVLDIGSGSAWTAALLANIVEENGDVTGLEIVPELVEFGRRNLGKYEFGNARIEKAGEGELGKQGQKFDRILVSASAKEMPEELIGQLKPGGIMVLPVGNSVWRVEVDQDGKVVKQEFPGFAFVPLV